MGMMPAIRKAGRYYYFFSTCRAQGVNPYEWLKPTLEHIADTKLPQLHTLLSVYTPETAGLEQHILITSKRDKTGI